MAQLPGASVSSRARRRGRLRLSPPHLPRPPPPVSWSATHCIGLSICHPSSGRPPLCIRLTLHILYSSCCSRALIGIVSNKVLVLVLGRYFGSQPSIGLGVARSYKPPFCRVIVLAVAQRTPPYRRDSVRRLAGIKDAWEGGRVADQENTGGTRMFCRSHNSW